MPTTIGQSETQRQATTAKLAADMDTLRTITTTVADDNTALAANTATVGANLKTSGKQGAGPFTKPDGTVYVIIVDTSAAGFHEVDLAGPDTVIPDPVTTVPPTVPPVTPDPNAPADGGTTTP